jgi:hypothetical protein
MIRFGIWHMYIAVLKISCEVHIEVKFSFSSWLLGIMYLCVCGGGFARHFSDKLEY